MLEVEFNLLSVGLGGFEMSAKIDQSNLKFYLSQIVGYNPRIASWKVLGTVLPVRGQSVVVYVLRQRAIY